VCALASGHIGASTSNRDWTGNRTQTWSSTWECCPDFTRRTSGLEITVHHCLSSPSSRGSTNQDSCTCKILSLIYIYVPLYSTHKWEDNFVLSRRAYFLFVFNTAYNFTCCIHTWILSSNTAAYRKDDWAPQWPGELCWRELNLLVMSNSSKGRG
jgi:hypothetical protein